MAKMQRSAKIRDKPLVFVLLCMYRTHCVLWGGEGSGQRMKMNRSAVSAMPRKSLSALCMSRR